MSLISFGEWLPDQASLGNGLSEIKNVLPSGSGYKPIRMLKPVSDALPSDAKGFAHASTEEGAVVNVAGTSTQLLQLKSGVWSDVSRAVGAYSVAADSEWAFVQFGPKLLAANHADPIQVIDVSSPVTFDDLAGNPPRARHLAVVGDFVVAGNVDTSPNRVHWSGFNNIEAWTPGVDNSDFQDLPIGGSVQAIVGGMDGVVFCDHAIYRMVRTGDDFVFQFDLVDDRRGLFAPRSAITVGSITYFLSHDGFYAWAGGESRPIGFGKVDKFFFSDLRQDYRHRITGVADPINKLIMWSYPSVLSSNGEPDRILVYNWVTNQWSRADVGASRLVTFLTEGYTLEGLDAVSGSLDGLAFSLDSRMWTDGSLALGAIDPSGHLSTFTGDTLAARLETREYSPDPLFRSYVHGALPLIEGAAPSLSLAYRDRLDMTVQYTSSRTGDRSAFVPFETSSRFFKIRSDLAEGSDWDNATGVHLYFRPDGELA